MKFKLLLLVIGFIPAIAMTQGPPRAHAEAPVIAGTHSVPPVALKPNSALTPAEPRPEVAKAGEKSNTSIQGDNGDNWLLELQKIIIKQP